jgi:flavodoxin
MNTLVIYDSVFGNTEKIAQAIAEVLSAKALRVSEASAKEMDGVGLLIAASPTRAFRPTPAMTEWLNALPSGSLKGLRVAAFDTRIRVEDIKPRLLRAMAKRFGYAADPILAALVKKGGAQTVAPEGFFVEDSEGPLKNGELQRAVTWAKALIQ